MGEHHGVSEGRRNIGGEKREMTSLETVSPHSQSPWLAALQILESLKKSFKVSLGGEVTIAGLGVRHICIWTRVPPLLTV